MKRKAAVFCFFRGYFLWNIFRASLGKFGQKSFAPPKICLVLHRRCDIYVKIRLVFLIQDMQPSVVVISNEIGFVEIHPMV